MKKMFPKSKVILKFSYLLVFFTLMYSCQTEELITPTTVGSNKTANTTLKTNLITPVSVKLTSGNCSTDCIKADGPFFETTDQQIVSWGGPADNKFTKTVDIIYYNTATDFVLKVKSTEGWSDLVIDGVSSWTQGRVAANAWGTLTLPLGTTWKACDLKSFLLQITGNGPQAVFNVDYNLFGVCNDCVTSFTAEAISCGTSREAVYTFKSGEDTNFKIQGGLTNFTGADAVITVTGGTNITKTQSIPGGSSNRTIKVEGEISKCSEITIRVTWNSTNSGGTITGSWSVSASNPAVTAVPIPGLTCN